MNIILSTKSTVPIYEQIVQQIQSAIFSGDLKGGHPLPSLRGLAKDLKVSIITTKRAYEELERLGLIETLSGKGSYVTESNQQTIIEKQKFLLEESVEALVKRAKSLSIQEDELFEMVKLYYENEE